MNAITAYLETMFASLPATPRIADAKAELFTMMEDAYNGYREAGMSENEAVGRVISEFGNLDEVAPVLGIDMSAEAEADTDRYPRITLVEAKGFAAAHERTAPRLARAVAMFVLSPLLIVTLPQAADTGFLPVSPIVATVIAFSWLAALVLGGIITVLGIEREFDSFKHIREGRFTRDPGVTAWSDALAARHSLARTRALQVSIVFWVLAPLPLILMSVLSGGDSAASDMLASIGVAIVLVMVAIGLQILLPKVWAHTVQDTLRNRGTRRRGERASAEESSLVGVIAAVYWPLMVAGYLAWSFIADAWDSSWIIWPIGGVLFGAIAGGIGAWESRKRAQ